MQEEIEQAEPKREESPEEKEINDDLANYKALEATMRSKGGQIILKNLRTDIANSVESLSKLSKAPVQDMIATIEKLNAQLNLYKLLMRSTENVILAEEALAELIGKDSSGL